MKLSAPLFQISSSALLCALMAQATILSRQGKTTTPDNTVVVAGTDNFCLVVPKDAHTNVGDSEYPGGETVYCSAKAKTSSLQGDLSPNFWSNVEFVSKTGVNGQAFVQLTGCINAGTLDRINPDDAGGQYDSSGGDGGLGNPWDSVCTGYNHYVELLEPRGPRACIRCCIDPADCPVSMDTSGCPAVIPGNYFNCG